jgi:hypothetical protein
MPASGTCHYGFVAVEKNAVAALRVSDEVGNAILAISPNMARYFDVHALDAGSKLRLDRGVESSEAATNRKNRTQRKRHAAGQNGIDHAPLNEISTEGPGGSGCVGELEIRIDKTGVGVAHGKISKSVIPPLSACRFCIALRFGATIGDTFRAFGSRFLSQTSQQSFEISRRTKPYPMTPR